MIKLISDKIIDAYELLNGMSFEEVAPYKDTVMARRIQIKDEKTELFVTVYEIKENDKDVEKLIEYIDWNGEGTDVITDLLCEYFEKYANQSNEPVSIPIENINDEILNTLSRFGFVRTIYKPNGMCLVYRK